MRKGRTQNSLQNVKYAIIGQGLGLAISFVTRMVFVKTLGTEYLGVDGLFTNILSILSLADLGLGAAVVYSLYKPLAEHDEGKIAVLIRMYRKAFFIIGSIVLGLGLLLMPFLDFFLKEVPDIPHLEIIFLMFVVNVSISYFFTYKRLLIIADQRRYITSLYRYSFYFGLNVLQILILLLTREYILFLALLLLSTLIENIFIARKANRLYPYVNNKEIAKQISESERIAIVKNVKAMSFHKIGGVIVNGTDSILLAKIVGVVSVGLYSNYLLITNALTIVFSLLFQGITASIGNLATTDDKEKMYFIFKVLNFMGFWIYAFFSIALFILLNPFITVWLGNDYLLSTQLVFVIVFNFFLTGMRKSVLTFRDALGLYWQDRYKPVFESLINIGVSIFLGIKLGIIGIFLGTAISTITTCFWIEPYILFRYGLFKKVNSYFIDYIKYSLLSFVVGYITYLACTFISYEGIGGFLLKSIIVVLIPNIVFIIIYKNKDEFKYIVDILLIRFLKKTNK